MDLIVVEPVLEVTLVPLHLLHLVLQLLELLIYKFLWEIIRCEELHE